MKKLAVVALGGNALLRGDQVGTIEEQEKNTKDTLENLIYLIEEGYGLVIGHGNGPQVGNILMRNDAGEEMYNIPQMPLDICVADSQGGIGYMIERMLRIVLQEHNIEKDVVTLVTQVVVDKDDPAFQNPTKRVGKIYTKEQADKLHETKGWIFKDSPKMKDGFRRVVASPEPLEVFNTKSIEELARRGTIVIAVGGGGVPVYIDENKHVRPLEAVIDKDKASSLLATKIKADEFYILTDVPYVFIDYNQPNERKIEFLNKADADKYMDEGKFGEGSMAPKIKAALNFVENGGLKSVITEATKLSDKSYGTKITLEYED
ncbi:MAG: carbamate kinase [Bacteroidales bacterium]|nr:carbamate kinase [Bacteroidales bacterium]MBN2757102.1 carbamate kinase [Bacteroidales bacterium]